MSWCVTHSQARRPSRLRLPSAAPSSSSFRGGRGESRHLWAMRIGSAPASTSSLRQGEGGGRSGAVAEAAGVGEHGGVEAGGHLRRDRAPAAFTSR